MISPAPLAYTADGTPYSEAFDDPYHSAAGGLGQAREVFMAGNALPERWRRREGFVILETGFGLGLNFLATWEAWRSDPERCGRLHFVSVEKHPFGAADLATLHSRWPEFAALSAELRGKWPPLVPGFHRLLLDGGRVSLTLIFGEAPDCLRQLVARVDAFYLDGFSPAKNPDLWSPALFRTLSRLAAPGATAATYTVAGSVREGLSAAGFVCEKLPGFGHKRHRLAARFLPRFPIRELPPVPRRQAIVIGAGIAGSTLCERLAARGWSIDLIERRDAPGREASGNHAGCLLPLLSRDDNHASRISRAAFLHALSALDTLSDSGFPVRWGRTGVLQLAKDERHAELQRSAVERLALPGDFVRFLDAESASALLGRPLEYGGWHFPHGGWANPPGLCRAFLDAAGDGVRRHFTTPALSLERRDGLWHALDGAGKSIAAAPVLILANGGEATAFPQAANLPLRRIRGQVSHLPAPFPAPSLAVCREGYLTPEVDGIACLGATFGLDDPEESLREADHAANLAHLERLLPGASAGIDPAGLEGKVGFRPASLDRLPLLGALPSGESQGASPPSLLKHLERLPDLHGALGYGSRGLVWAPLMAELLACQLEGEPLPLEADLVSALDPGRFLLRAAKRGSIPEWPSED